MEQQNSVRSSAPSANILDLAFSNQPLEVCKCDKALTKIDEYHQPLLITTAFTPPNAPRQHQSFRNFKKVNWRNLKDHLMIVNWPLHLDAQPCLDAKVNSFYEVLNKHLDCHCPLKTVKITFGPAWISRESSSEEKDPSRQMEAPRKPKGPRPLPSSAKRSRDKRLHRLQKVQHSC